MSKKKILPKRLAGIKIPKKIRRGALGDFLASDAGQKMLAEGILMVGAAVLGRETAAGSGARKALKQAEGAAADAGGMAAGAVHEAPARVAQAFNAAMAAFRHALHHEAEPGEAAELEVEPSKKKRSPNPPELSTAH